MAVRAAARLFRVGVSYIYKALIRRRRTELTTSRLVYHYSRGFDVEICNFPVSTACGIAGANRSGVTDRVGAGQSRRRCTNGHPAIEDG